MLCRRGFELQRCLPPAVAGAGSRLLLRGGCKELVCWWVLAPVVPMGRCWLLLRTSRNDLRLEPAADFYGPNGTHTAAVAAVTGHDLFTTMQANAGIMEPVLQRSMSPQRSTSTTDLRSPVVARTTSTTMEPAIQRCTSTSDLHGALQRTTSTSDLHSPLVARTTSTSDLRGAL